MKLKGAAGIFQESLRIPTSTASHPKHEGTICKRKQSLATCRVYPSGNLGVLAGLSKSPLLVLGTHRISAGYASLWRRPFFAVRAVLHSNARKTPQPHNQNDIF